jgi:hypothetical protein
LKEKDRQVGLKKRKMTTIACLFQATEDKFVIDETGPTSLIIIDNTEEVHEVIFCNEAGELL